AGDFFSQAAIFFRPGVRGARRPYRKRLQRYDNFLNAQALCEKILIFFRFSGLFAGERAAPGRFSGGFTGLD
ncbi:MAG: hypothetical protein IJU35_00605, partial [Paludibacteraceae bacterium]|nr:hypothetical protein [Paludibacteraceae bacterium]